MNICAVLEHFVVLRYENELNIWRSVF